MSNPYSFSWSQAVAAGRPLAQQAQAQGAAIWPSLQAQGAAWWNSTGYPTAINAAIARANQADLANAQTEADIEEALLWILTGE